MYVLCTLPPVWRSPAFGYCPGGNGGWYRDHGFLRYERGCRPSLYGPAAAFRQYGHGSRADRPRDQIQIAVFKTGRVLPQKFIQLQDLHFAGEFCFDKAFGDRNVRVNGSGHIEERAVGIRIAAEIDHIARNVEFAVLFGFFNKIREAHKGEHIFIPEHFGVLSYAAEGIRQSIGLWMSLFRIMYCLLSHFLMSDAANRSAGFHRRGHSN